MGKRVAVLAPVVAAVLVLGGCGAPEGPPDGPPEATGTLEELAAKAGCVPDLQTRAAEIRQADCRTADGRYVLVAFATDRGRQEWLDAADDYGGSRLVGRRWVAVGDESVLAVLRGRLGGTVHRSVGHPGDPGHPGRTGPSDHPGPTGDPGHTGHGAS
jgi:hypothetical protein